MEKGCGTGKARAITLGVVCLITALTMAGSCTQKTAGPDPASSPAEPAPRTEFEKDLRYVRNGQFAHIYVFARPDGAVLTSEDIAYLKDNSPKQTNMWVKTEGGHRIIAGSNFDFPAENMAALRKRFSVEESAGR